MNEQIKTLFKSFSLRYHRPKVMFMLSGAFLFLSLFIELTFALGNERFQALDEKFLLNLVNARTPLLSGIARDITSLGSPVLIILVSVMSLLILLKKNKLAAIYVAFNSIGSTTCSELLKHIIDRDRPSVVSRLVVEYNQSYPSGHALVTTTVYLSFAYLLSQNEYTRRVRILVYSFACSIILLVSLSRVYLGVHYPSDVLSSIFFGASLFLFSTALYKTIT